MLKILVANGPNINLLGIRERNIYGDGTYADLLVYVTKTAFDLDIIVDFFQSNHEGEIIDKLQQARGVYDGIVLNPAAYTHTSIAIYDTLKAIEVPAVEVHISDISSREDFRKNSFISAACIKTICGKGFAGYGEALIALKEHLVKA